MRARCRWSVPPWPRTPSTSASRLPLPPWPRPLPLRHALLPVPVCPPSPTSAHEGHLHAIGRAQGALVPSRDGVEEPFIGSATTQRLSARVALPRAATAPASTRENEIGRS